MNRKSEFDISRILQIYGNMLYRSAADEITAIPNFKSFHNERRSDYE